MPPIPHDKDGVGSLVSENTVVCASRGDVDSIQRLIVHCHHALHVKVAGARDAALANRIDPDDVLQEAYASAYKALCPSEPEPRQTATVHDFKNSGHFYKWLESIALNQLRDDERALRRQRRDPARERRLAGSATESYPALVWSLVASDATPSREVARAEAIAAVMSSLARLPDDQRRVIRLRFVHGVSYAEIAERMERSVDALYVICHQGLKALRGYLVSITRYLTSL